MPRRCEKGVAGSLSFERASSVPSCLPFRPPCFRSYRETHFFLLQMSRSDFSVTLSAGRIRKRAADRILEQYRSGNDDALVLVGGYGN